MSTSPVTPEIAHAPGQFIELDDGRLWIEIEGPADGEPLVLLSGGPASSHLTFHPCFSSLADQYRVIYVDYRGRGRSDKPASYHDITFARDVADIEALRQKLGIASWNVYGFSYGGMVAQGYALAHPGAVRRLVLANTLHSPEMWQRNHENINRELASQFPEVWDRIVELRARGVRSSAPEIRELYRVHGPLVRFYNPDNAVKLLSEPGARDDELYYVFVGDDIEFFIGGEVAKLPDFRPRLKELAMPTLIIAGRYDRALYPRYQREFADYAPEARFIMMERSGCFAHVEEPAALLTLLREFLA